MERDFLIASSATSAEEIGNPVHPGTASRLAREGNDALTRKVEQVEPALVLVTSLLVGAILLSVMLPLMNIMAAIG